MAWLIRTTWFRCSVLGILLTKCIYVLPLLLKLLMGFQTVDGKVKVGSYYSINGLGIRSTNHVKTTNGPWLRGTHNMWELVQFDSPKNWKSPRINYHSRHNLKKNRVSSTTTHGGTSNIASNQLPANTGLWKSRWINYSAQSDFPLF